MSKLDLIIEERSRDIGDFMVGRLIPFRKKRAVGPFTFIDHMTPMKLGPNHYLDVGQHPHAGLATLTYLFEGQIMHEDSTGAKQLITPDSVNLMIAGKGASHTERTPKHLVETQTQFIQSGYQIWIALPKEKEEMEPEFHNIKVTDLPQWKEETANFKLIAGKGFGKESPVPTLSPLFMVDIQTHDQPHQLNIKDQLEGEIGITIVKGAIDACEHIVEEGNMLVSKIENQCSVTIQPHSHLLLFGGEPLPEEHYIYWNFVSSSKEKLKELKQQWNTKNFPMIEGDTSFIPAP